MTEALLSLVAAPDLAQEIEDLLLENPGLAGGFLTTAGDGHGSSVPLLDSAERVSGHAPRMQLQMVGEVDELRAVLDLLRERLPHAKVFYWLVPVIEAGRIA